MRKLADLVPASAAAWKLAVCLLVSGFAITGCGAGGVGQANAVTCDEYSQKEYAPSGIGAEAQTSDLLDLLEQHDLPWSVPLLNDVQEQVNDFCGRPSPDGGKPAKRNNSRPIDEGVDWGQVG